ncbi:hypothetical protein [Bacillus sp. 166amftsu]|uniref:hypothetical protein n=1 Tax=Bacillus sp. 166amftsu TaxID=1761753 RepID=UPI001FCD62C1|nr:hypothetical protein [Bacillus sp. 166amftsu]
MVKLGIISLEDLTVEACVQRVMKIGKNCSGLAESTIDYAHCWLIEIGDNVTFAPKYISLHMTPVRNDI